MSLWSSRQAYLGTLLITGCIAAAALIADAAVSVVHLSNTAPVDTALLWAPAHWLQQWVGGLFLYWAVCTVWLRVLGKLAGLDQGPRSNQPVA